MRRRLRNQGLAGLGLASVSALALAIGCTPATGARSGTRKGQRSHAPLAAAAAITAPAARKQPGAAVARAENALLPVPETQSEAGTHPLPFDLATVRKTLASIPALAAFATSFVPFSDSDVDAALRRGGRSRSSIQLWTTMPSLFSWNPVPDKTLWVLSGRVGKSALLAVLEPSKSGTIARAESTLIDEADATLALGASSEYPTQLTWSTCYGCAGEGGTVRFADDGRVELTYR